jgi:hypothetical protein
MMRFGLRPGRILLLVRAPFYGTQWAGHLLPAMPATLATRTWRLRSATAACAIPLAIRPADGLTSGAADTLPMKTEPL